MLFLWIRLQQIISTICNKGAIFFFYIYHYIHLQLSAIKVEIDSNLLKGKGS